MGSPLFWRLLQMTDRNIAWRAVSKEDIALIFVGAEVCGDYLQKPMTD